MKVCSICGEPAEHRLRDCPATQNADETLAELIRVRKTLRNIDLYFGQSCTHTLAVAVRERLNWPKTE